MRFRTLVWREIFNRKSQLATSFIAIVLGIGAIVGIKNITVYSEKAVMRSLDALGVNILVLPKSATVQDYYSADMQQDEFPEEYVGRLMMSGIQGLDNLSPKLSMAVKVRDKTVTLTGILPKSEFQAKAAWASAGVFARPKGCGDGPTVPTPIKETEVRRKVIKTLEPREALVGADVAASLKVGEGDTVDLFAEPFTITAVLPATGTVDDGRIFAHLHTIQQLAGKGPVINVIEIVGCCQEISGGLVKRINDLLPEAKVVTIQQIVDTQVNTNQMMSRLSMVFLVIIVLVGGASIANYMYSNVFERRREIGTLMALGAGPWVILRLFMFKAALLGLAGGLCGYALGTLLAVILGPRLAGIPVLPMPVLIVWGLGLSLAIAVVASYFPARRAARMDPFTALREM